MEVTMIALGKAILAAATVLTLTAGAASAAVVCNSEGDCWHVRGRPAYRPEFGLRIYGDDWRWRRGENFRWREHLGHGYWRNGVWIDIR
jgi:hypothetical protein